MKNISFTQLTFLFFALGILTFSCKKDVSSVEPTDPTIVANISEHADFFEDPSEESDRLTMVNETIVLNDTTLERSECTKYSAWSKIAEVTTFPNDGGSTMSATHIAQIDDLAIVSYHIRGQEYLGVVEIWDISNPSSLKYKGYVKFVGADVNSVTAEQNPSGNTRRVWVALSDKKKGAMVAELNLGANKKFDKNYLRLSQLTKAVEGEASASANAIAEAGDYLYVTAGQSVGGIFTLNKTTLEVLGSKSFSDAKGVAVNGTGASADVAAIKTKNGAAVYLDKVGGFSFDQSFAIDEIYHQNVETTDNGKITAAFAGPGSPYLFVSSGDLGLKGYDIATGEVVYETPATFLRSGNSNGISIDEDYLYVANGADGIAICPLVDHLPDANSVYLWDMDEPSASANYISNGSNWVVIAKGEGGFKLLKKATPGDCLPICAYDNDGVPACLANDVVVCSTLQDRVAAAMPLDANLQNVQPSFFTNGAAEILLTKDTELKVTFVEENTDRQNSMGFYFYHSDCPPESKEDLVGMVTFANFSAEGSEGKLEKGHTVKLPGTFKEGTYIGFFLIRNGFAGGHDIYYSNNNFNPAGKTQSLLFHDSECGDLIGAFQGDPVPSSDADFRDMIFKITTSVPDAYDPDSYLRL